MTDRPQFHPIPPSKEYLAWCERTGGPHAWEYDRTTNTYTCQCCLGQADKQVLRRFSPKAE